MKIRAKLFAHDDIASLLLLLPRHCYQQYSSIAKVRLKWVKNRSFDHVIDTETDLKAACLLKDAIKRSPTGYLTAKSFADWQKLLGLTFPVLRFMRRYPTLFKEFPHTQYTNLPCFELTSTAVMLDSQEQTIHQNNEIDTVERLSRVLMMTRNQTMPLNSLHPLKWDLGLPDYFEKILIPKYPDHFRFVKATNGSTCLRLNKWSEELAVSALQRNNESTQIGNEYQQFKRGQTTLSYPMSFPRGYGSQKKVKAWMEDFQKLPYISPYEDSKKIDPNSDLMEKRVVGVLHEFLSLTLHKKTKRNYFRSIREELNLPQKFTRLFTRYPGIFYLSMKCKTTTVALRECYKRGKVVDPHPLAKHRYKFYYVMRTGLIYRNKGENHVSQETLLEDVEKEIDVEESKAVEDEEEDEECDTSNEEMSGSEEISDED